MEVKLALPALCVLRKMEGYFIERHRNINNFGRSRLHLDAKETFPHDLYDLPCSAAIAIRKKSASCLQLWRLPLSCEVANAFSIYKSLPGHQAMPCPHGTSLNLAIFQVIMKRICLKTKSSPGWCGSVDWVLDWETKGHWFNSQSGHMPGLQARSPVGGVWEATTYWCFSPSLSPSLLLSLKINK